MKLEMSKNSIEKSTNNNLHCDYWAVLLNECEDEQQPDFCLDVIVFVYGSLKEEIWFEWPR